MEKRNFRKNPLTADELLYTRWYAVVDDCIGGYTVATANKPTSELNIYAHEFQVANFVMLQSAQHIAQLHNAWLDEFVWESYLENMFVGLARRLDGS